MGSSQTLGTLLIGIGALLGLVGIAWLGVNAASGILEPGGLVLGLFFLLLFILPVVGAGVYVRQQSSERAASSSAFEERRRLLERDRIFRQNLQLQAGRVAEAFERKALGAPMETESIYRQIHQILSGLAAEAGQRVSEADWLHATPLGEADARDIERYDDLLLAGIRRLRQGSERTGTRAESPEAAQEMLELARSVERQFALRQDLVLRGRRLPEVSPLQLLHPSIPSSSEVMPEDLQPGDAVSHFDKDYLVTSHATYFSEGRRWHALALRGEDGERRLQVEPGDDRLLFMEPVSPDRLPGKPVTSGTASVTVDSLSGVADGVVVDFRRTQLGESVGWWERWPGGDRSYLGEPVAVTEFRFWPSAVGPE